MRFAETEISGVLVVEPDVYRDARGYFLETFHADKYAAAGIPSSFVQDNHSASVRNTLRGLHMQVRAPQGKLIRVTEGEVLDVAVDLRPRSPTFGRWISHLLSADNFLQLYIPPGCAHGFYVTSATAQVQYKCSAFYDPADEVGVAWNDPELGIAWPSAHPLLSDRDSRHPRLADVLPRLSLA